MDGAAIAALIGAAVLSFTVRAFNTILRWLAKALGVEPPAPIPEPGSDEPS